MNKKTSDLLKETDTNKNEINTALDLMASKKKPDEKTEVPKITVGNVKSYKEHEVAVAINNFLSKNLDEESGGYLVGENAARTMEHYGLKGHPVLGLIIAIGMVTVHYFMKNIKEKKPDEKQVK